MPPAPHDVEFIGAIPRVYDEYMVPLVFQHYATDLVQRVVARRPTRVLELAAGTGVVTRGLAQALPAEVPIIATDLNLAMLAHAAEVGTHRAVEWRAADAQQLPFDAGAFDAVVCQFGVMFFPDKVKAFAEAHRVLAPGGVLLFNVWDRLEENEFAHTVSASLEAQFPHDPPRFMSRTPHGYFERSAIEHDLAQGGFQGPVQFETLVAQSQAPSAQHAAIALCQGTPVRGELEARGASLAEVTRHARDALARRFGPGPIEGKIQGHVISVER